MPENMNTAVDTTVNTAITVPFFFASIPDFTEFSVVLPQEVEGSLAICLRDASGDHVLGLTSQKGSRFNLAMTGSLVSSDLVLQPNVAINPFNKSRSSYYLLFASGMLSAEAALERFKSQLDGPQLPLLDGVEIQSKGALFVPPEVTLEEDANLGLPLPISSEGPDRVNYIFRCASDQKMGTLVTHMPGAPSGFQTMTASRGGSSVTFTPATQSGGNHSQLGWGNFHALYSQSGPVTVSYTYNGDTYSEVFLAAGLLDVTVTKTVPDSNRHPNQQDSPIDLELSWNSTSGFTYTDA